MAARKQSGCRVVLNCELITFMDSRGLCGLLELRHQATAAGAWFALMAPSDPVVRVLELSGTRGYFTILDGALAAGPGGVPSGLREPTAQ